MTNAIAEKLTTERMSRVVEVATDYFAYIAGISVAVAIAAMALVYSAQTALSVVSRIAIPERPAIDMRSTLPAERDAAPSAANTFAMLPAAGPLVTTKVSASTDF
ncbi:MAG: hypothetical protein ACT4OU_04905 [Hyphomicrobium sp.]